MEAIDKDVLIDVIAGTMKAAAAGGPLSQVAEQTLAALQAAVPFDVGALLIARPGQDPDDESYSLTLFSPDSAEDDLLALARERVAEAYQTPSEPGQPLNAHAPETPLPSRLSVPLPSGERLVGVLELSSEAPEAYSADDERTLSTLASALAPLLEIAVELASLRGYASDLEEADHTKDELLQDISHELRNPLTFIRGYVELLAEGELGPLTEEQSDAVGVISSKADTLMRLVTEVLSLHRLTPEMLELTPVDVSALLAEAMQGVEASANARTLDVRLEVPTAPQMVLADIYRLAQVFDNLLGNALKFSHTGGTVTARVVDLGERVRTEVQDEGVGIDPQAQPHIFERFFKGESGKRNRLGAGLGLSIAREIVEAHGGEIGVTSVPGQGSTFFVELEKYEAS